MQRFARFLSVKMLAAMLALVLMASLLPNLAMAATAKQKAPRHTRNVQSMSMTPMSMSPMVQSTPAFSGGSGTQSDPFQIATASDLSNIRQVETQTHYYELTADIDLSGYGKSYNTTDGNGDPLVGWDPIGDFTSNENAFEGHFNGNGHIITGLCINSLTDNALNDVGLFGVIDTSATVTGVTLENVAINAPDGLVEAGALAGENNGAVSYCCAGGTVSGGYFTGGLVGYNNQTTSNSYATVSVDSPSGGDYGGLAGENDGDIANCFATGSVSGEGGDSWVGGLIGYIDTSGSLEDSYAIGAVSGAEAGGLAGENDGAITDSYWDTDTTGAGSDTGGGTGTSDSANNGETNDAMMQPATFVGWNASNWVDQNGSYPYLLGVGSATLTSIAITTPANKLTYNVGDALDLTGLVVTGYYSNSTTQAEPVTAADVSGFNSSAPNSAETLTITYGGQTTTYTVTILGTQSHSSADDTLMSLTLSTGTLNQTFAPGTLAYTASVPNGVTSDTVSAVASSVYAQVYINGLPGAIQTMPLSVGDNSVAIKVYAQDGANQTYTLTVNEASASSGSGVMISGFTVTDSSHNVVPAGTALTHGNQYYLAMTVQNGSSASLNPLFIIEVLQGGQMLSLDGVQAAINPNGSSTITALYTPSSTGTIDLDFYVWSNWLNQGGLPLAQPVSGTEIVQ